MSVERTPGLRMFADVDFSPLRGPSSGPTWHRLDRPLPPVLDIGLTILALTAGSVLVFVPFGILFAEVSAAQRAVIGIWGAVALVLVTGVVVFFRRWRRRHGRRLHVANPRLEAFAEANGFDYRGSAQADSRLPAAAGQAHMVQRVGPRLAPRTGSGVIPFEIGYRFFHSPVAPDFVPTERRPYPITLDEGWYVAVPLPRRLPHIALLRRADRQASNLDQASSYSMGIEFDATFTLLCPPGYERDALYLFTPDVMAAMLDDAGAGQFGAEILDDHLFFRFPLGHASSLVFAEDLERAFLLVERTTAELAKQAERYADERIDDRAANLVAVRGRRVGTRVRPTMVVAGFGIPLMILAPFVMMLTTMLPT